MSQRYLCFSLGKEQFALPLLDIREVMGVPQIAPVPFAPSHYKGITNLRGQVISVIDLRPKLGIEPLNGPETSVVICDMKSSLLGLVVDSVNMVASPEDSEISLPPATESGTAKIISGVYRKENELIMILQVDSLLDSVDKDLISKAQAAA